MPNTGFFLLVFLICALSCTSSTEQINTPRHLNEDFKSYWYDGEAEISFYELSQSRYGEERKGEMYLIFVTEDFNSQLQVKTEESKSTSESHFKLNWHQHFPTGIYDYNIMQSTFLSLENQQNATKLVSSMQEWCGQSYLQLNKRAGNFQVKLHSYFEEINDNEFSIAQAYTENQLMLDLRIQPTLEQMPQQMIPNLTYLQLNQKEIKAYPVIFKQTIEATQIVTQIEFPDLNRKVQIKQSNQFPYRIEQWKEAIGAEEEEQISEARLINSMRVDYWNKNKEKDLILRENLKTH